MQKCKQRRFQPCTIGSEGRTLEETTQCGASRPCQAGAQFASPSSHSSISTLVAPRSSAQGPAGNSIRIANDNSSGAVTFDSHLTLSQPSLTQSARISSPGKPAPASPYRKVGSHGLRIQPTENDKTSGREPAASQDAQGSLSGGIPERREPLNALGVRPPASNASAMPIRSARGSSQKKAPVATSNVRL